MSNIPDQEMDKLFRQAADGYQPGYDEKAWKAMTKKLDATGGGSMAYYKILAVVVAVFIVGGGWIWWRSSQMSVSEISAHEVVAQDSMYLLPMTTFEKPSQSLPPAGRVLRNAEAVLSNPQSPRRETLRGREETTSLQTVPIGRQGSMTKQFQSSKDIPQNFGIVSSSSVGIAMTGEEATAPPEPSLRRGTTKQSQPSEVIPLQPEIVSPSSASRRIVMTRGAGEGIDKLQPLPISTDPLYPGVADIQPVAIHTDHAVLLVRQPAALALKLMYSPDYSSIGFFKPDKPGNNFGLMVEYHLKRWAFSTGALVSRKVYASEETYSLYGQPYDYDHLDAACKVIDIPLNVSYYMQKPVHRKYGLYTTLGLSSYLMLSEDYTYTGTSYGKPTVWTTRYTHENNHFLGIMNVSIGYERRLTPHFFIQVEPFLKAPIAGIGEGKVDLVSAGAFFNLKYQFFK